MLLYALRDKGIDGSAEQIKLMGLLPLFFFCAMFFARPLVLSGGATLLTITIYSYMITEYRNHWQCYTGLLIAVPLATEI